MEKCSIDTPEEVIVARHRQRQAAAQQALLACRTIAEQGEIDKSITPRYLNYLASIALGR